MSKPPATLALWTTRPFSHGGRRENPCGGSSPHGRRKPERRQPMAVAVLSSTQQRLMPTSPYRARKLLRAGKAEIFFHQPFTIRLTKRADGEVQPVELCMDTGYQHIGISVKSNKLHCKIPYQRCVCDGTVPSKAPDRTGLMDQTPAEQPVPGKVLRCEVYRWPDREESRREGPDERTDQPEP